MKKEAEHISPPVLVSTLPEKASRLAYAGQIASGHGVGDTAMFTASITMLSVLAYVALAVTLPTGWHFVLLGSAIVLAIIVASTPKRGDFGWALLTPLRILWHLALVPVLFPLIALTRHDNQLDAVLRSQNNIQFRRSERRLIRKNKQEDLAARLVWTLHERQREYHRIAQLPESTERKQALSVLHRDIRQIELDISTLRQNGHLPHTYGQDAEYTLQQVIAREEARQELP